MRSPLSHVPYFARLHDYFGLWAADFVSGQFDPRSHLTAGPQGKLVQSNVSMVPVKGGKNIAYVKIAGALMKGQPWRDGTSTLQLIQDVRASAKDPNVQGILLGIDSPGGTVAGTAALASEVRAARKAKPVWAHVQDLAASAAYWVGSQASAMYASNATDLIGSIGTITTVYDYSVAAEQQGIKAHVFRTGPLKGLGTPGAPVTEEQVSHMQSLVNSLQTHFDAAVMKGRGFTAKQLDSVRTGGVFPAGEAVSLRLIDGIRSLDATAEALAAVR